MIDTEPVITLPMYVPSGFAPEPAPLPLATNKVEPSAETVTAVGYQPTGISPATRIPARSRRTTATALLPAIATYRVRPSGESASALGSLPTGACGARATVSCSTTWPVAVYARHAVRARERDEQFTTAERERGRMGADEEGGSA